MNTYSGIEGSGTITGLENWGEKLWISYQGNIYDYEDGGAPFLTSCDDISDIQNNNCLEHSMDEPVYGLVSYSTGGGAINRLYFFVESINNARILKYCNDYNDCSNSIEVYNPGKAINNLVFTN